MEINAITEYKKDPDDGGHISHLARRPDNSSFMDPDHKEVGLSEGLEVDIIRECKGNQGEGDDKESATNEPEGPSFREPDHKAVRMEEGPHTQDYGKAGCSMESTSASKTGNAVHMQKTGYHLGHEEHIEAIGPAW